MAERKRRGREAANGRRADASGGSPRDADETVAEEPLDDTDADELAADANEAVSDDDADSGSSKKRASGGGTTTISRPKQTKTGSTTRTGVFGIFARLFGFVREVVAELRKVIWPTRVELITYTTVVVVFVTIMLTIVGLFDLGFAKAVLWVFGSGSTSSAE